MKRRSAATVFSIIGLAVAAIGTAVVVPQAGPPSPALDAAGAQYGNESAPGNFCQRMGNRPGTPAFRNCVRTAAKARSQARNGDKRGGNRRFPAESNAGRFCKANGAFPPSKAFKNCVKTANKASAGGGARR